MKRNVILVALFGLLAIGAKAQQCVVKHSDYSQVELEFSVGRINVQDANIDREIYAKLHIDGFGEQQKVGYPALPSMVKLVEIPLGSGLHYTVTSMECDTIDGSVLGLGSAIVPAQPPRRKSDTTRHALMKDQGVYSRDAFCGDEMIKLEEIGVARNRNLARVSFNPIRWNPVSNEVIVVKRVTVSIKKEHADIAATQQMQKLHASPYFHSSESVVNTLGTKDGYTTAPMRYTIIAYSGFRGALDDFANWKRRQGFLVDLVYTDDAAVGNTINSIKSYLQGLYDNATAAMPAPTYVLFVGDVEQLPAQQMTASPYSSESQYSDSYYCLWTGNDYLPDCYYGRFSAQNLSQLEPQISKTLMYEQYTFPDDSYLSNAALIAGVDRGMTSDNAYTYGDPAMDYVAKTYINSANGYNNVVYYKNNTSFAPAGVTVTGSSRNSSTSTELITFYNNGCGWVNYTAHGSETSWGDPSLTNSHVNSLANNNKPMIMIGNCCLTNSFQISSCFGETLLRKGNNAGAVAYVGGSNSTYWSEDFYWSVGVRSNINNTCDPSYDVNNLGMYDRLFHTHNEPYRNWYITMGSIIRAGNMAVESSSTSAGMKEYYWQIYHLMGDPSLMPYIHGQAETLSVSMPQAFYMGMESVDITTEPYAYVGLTDGNHNLKGAAMANAAGVATLPLTEITEPGTYEIVITAQGYRPYIQNVTVVSEGPYVIATAMTANGELRSNSDVNFEVTIKNVGVEATESLSVEFQTPDGNMLLTSSVPTTLSNGLSANAVRTLHSVCNGHIWGNVSDNTPLDINVVIRWGNNANQRSTRTFHFNIAADKVKLDHYDLVDNGDTATLIVTNVNRGGAELIDGSVSLLSLDPRVVILDATHQLSHVGAGESESHSYTLCWNGEKPNDQIIPILQSVHNGFTTTKDTLRLLFGTVYNTITYEDNSFGNVEWEQGENPWELTTSGVYEGQYCMRSRTWTGSYGPSAGHGQSSSISIRWNSIVDDSITFWNNVSSENNYDYFYFRIDGVDALVRCGTSNEWQRYSFPVSAGEHVYEFVYDKDQSYSYGSDCAWIDNLTLPMSGEVTNHKLDTICEGESYTFNDSVLMTESLTTGIYYFSDSSDHVVSHLILVVSETPDIVISNSSDTIRAGESVRLDASASNAEQYLWSSGQQQSIIDVYPVETTTYTVTGYNGRCSSSAEVTIVVDGSIGIDVVEGDGALRIYPNPAHGRVTLEGKDIVHVAICDLSGREVKRFRVEGEQPTLDVSGLSNGMYLLIATDSKGNRSVQRFVKK